jgi:hypothetical protein
MAILPSTALAQQVSAKKKPAADAPTPGLMGGVWHGAVELRHQLVSFYDETNAPVRQEPTVHTRAQLGAQFYDGLADLYATLGVYKRAETVQVQQRRPELALDLRPVTSEYVDVLQYTIVKLPFQQQEPDPEAHEAETSDGSILVFGLAPLLKAPVDANGTRLTFKAGFEAWTKLYSRKQYTGAYDDAATEEDEGRLALATTIRRRSSVSRSCRRQCCQDSRPTSPLTTTRRFVRAIPSTRAASTITTPQTATRSIASSWSTS